MGHGDRVAARNREMDKRAESPNRQPRAPDVVYIPFAGAGDKFEVTIPPYSAALIAMPGETKRTGFVVRVQSSDADGLASALVSAWGVDGPDRIASLVAYWHDARLLTYDGRRIDA